MRHGGAVRLTHMPTGICVTVQHERSPHKNRLMAMQLLKARLFMHYMKEEANKLVRTYVDASPGLLAEQLLEAFEQKFKHWREDVRIE